MSEERAGLPIRAFDNAAGWEAWLAAAPRDTPGLWVKLAKAGNGASSLTRAQAVDGALIHGWIDGQQHPYDASWWLVRFTPRRPRSRWSQKNRTRIGELDAAGRMQPAGLAEVAAAQADGRWEAAYAPASTATVPDDLAIALDAAPGARAFFDALDSANRYAILHRIDAMKRAETRARKVAQFAAMCAQGESIFPRRTR